MHAKHWLIGCILCIVGTGSAMASTQGSQDVDNATRAVSDSASSQRDGSSDVSDLTSRNSAPRPIAHDTSANAPVSSSDHSGSSGSAPPPVRQPHLGWQSLLPGSIQ